MRNFNQWHNTFRKSINTFSYYVDFEKVFRNVDDIKVELNILNSLIGSKNIQSEFIQLVENYPSVLKCIPILLAIRQNEIYVQDGQKSWNFDFSRPNYSLEEYSLFMEKTGLFSLISDHLINNLYDYCLGVETGLDSNGRKNRGGDQMEDLVESYLIQTGLDYYKEMYLHEIEMKWNINLSSISAEGTTTKRWDFALKAADTVFVFETNFYASGGSKLNETARSYKMIAEESRSIPYFQFVWITDGGGWVSARRNLEETFNSMEHLYNIKDLENGILFDLLSVDKYPLLAADDPKKMNTLA